MEEYLAYNCGGPSSVPQILDVSASATHMFPLQGGNDELVIQFNHVDVDDPNKEEEEKKKKKMVHRDIERQRRKDMAALHASLRSLLPLHFIKGKRSVSDQMNQAVIYIKQLQKDIKELTAKRDQLKKNYSNHASTFTLHHTSNGRALGIQVTSAFTDPPEVFPLSKLLQLLLQEGLQVFTCFSTRVNGRLLHTLHCEVKNSDRVDLPELRRKFVSMIPSFRCAD